jgi:cell shape-determining protein MreD
MKRWELIVSIILHAIFLIVVYIFQAAIFPHMRLDGLVPLMLPVAVAGVALYEGRYVGGITGLFAGILCDISFNQPAASFTVLLTLIGLAVGLLSETIFLPGFVTFLLTSAGVLIVCAFVQMVPLLMTPLMTPGVQPIPLAMLMNTAIAQTTYSLVVAIPIWFFVRALGKRADRRPQAGPKKEKPPKAKES